MRSAQVCGKEPHLSPFCPVFFVFRLFLFFLLFFPLFALTLFGSEGDEISILGERVVEGVSEGSGLLHKSTFGIDRSGKRVQVYFQSDEIRPGRFLTGSARVFGVDDRGRVWVKMDQIGQTGLSTEHVSSIGPKKIYNR